MAYCETTRRERAGVEKGERERARLQINYPRRSLRRYNKIISGRLYRDSGCERRGRHKVAACAPTAAVINNERRSGGGLHKHGAPSCHFFASSHHLSKLSSSSSLLLLLLLLLYPRLDLVGTQDSRATSLFLSESRRGISSFPRLSIREEVYSYSEFES